MTVEANSPPFCVLEATIAEIHEAFRGGTLTARRLVEIYLDRVKAYDRNGPTINSIISLNLGLETNTTETTRHIRAIGLEA